MPPFLMFSFFSGGNSLAAYTTTIPSSVKRLTLRVAITLKDMDSIAPKVPGLLHLDIEQNRSSGSLCRRIPMLFPQLRTLRIRWAGSSFICNVTLWCLSLPQMLGSCRVPAVFSTSSLVSQIFPSGARERLAEPPPAATPGEAGAAGWALVHSAWLPERSPVAQPLCAGADQPAQSAVGEQDHRHHHDASEKPSKRMWLCVGRGLTSGRLENWKSWSVFTWRRHQGCQQDFNMGADYTCWW